MRLLLLYSLLVAAGCSSKTVPVNGRVKFTDGSDPSPLAGADANAVVHRQYKHFAVADCPFLAGATPFDNRFDRRLDEVVVHGNLKLHLAQQIDLVLVAAIHLRLTFLPSKTLAIEHGQ